MSESAKHIKNPLTLISIFAGAAELSGVAILPLIHDPNQAVYINFLIFFPTFIIILFFATLNFNHRALYAPSDYKDEKNFVDPFGRATPEELKRKLAEETREVQADVQDFQSEIVEKATSDITTGDASTSQSSINGRDDATVESDANTSVPNQVSESSQIPDSPQTADETPHLSETKADKNGDMEPPSVKDNDWRSLHNNIHHSYDHNFPKTTIEKDLKNLNLPKLPNYDPKTFDLMEPYELEHRKLMASVALTEKLAVSKLSKALNLDLKADVSFQPHNSAVKYVFDAADYRAEEIQVVEVKLFTNRFDPNRFTDTLLKAHNLSRTFKSKGLTLHLVVVLETPYISPSDIRNLMADMIAEYKFNTIIHVTTTADLQSEVGRFY